MSKRPLAIAAAILAAPLLLAGISSQTPGDLTHPYRDRGERFESNYGFPTVNWAGYEWGVRETNSTIHWGDPQAEDPADGQKKWVQGATVQPNGDLSIRTEGIAGGVELNLVESTGYGTYTFTYSADFDEMDPHTVLGIFPYDMAEMELNTYDEVHVNSAGSTELDFIEISRWGDTSLPLPRGGVTYYPDARFNNRPDDYVIDRFDIPPGRQTLTTVAEWEEDSLRVTTTTEDGTVLSSVTSTVRVPEDTGTQQLRVNLWVTSRNTELIDGQRAFTTAEPAEVTFSSFSYNPKRAREPAEQIDAESGDLPITCRIGLFGC
ncbi:hypothetical protein CGLAU_11035 [Corynebacterium glaucum]|uniref:GH16 domain-containing protein n=1 Tax=Corynebacterium glaucum TaxID=187491 RepID=A0A1Q2HZ68_9CORY|nr:hypothetical protein [Corynebacterium glaucum]AQQ16141.1 hypothetical protein CGLAU_11035 [Corynebacterium glaucum]WJZ08627.1 hypothetical protein CGLAUT_10845 [Corynebacterium glaucum]